MNILLPIGGKGERFSSAGFSDPKPLIRVFHKEMIRWVLDHIRLRPDDSIFVFYYPPNVERISVNSEETPDFESFLMRAYPRIRCVPLPKQTCGAAETLALGIAELLRQSQTNTAIRLHSNTMVMDCDTFYRTDVVERYARFVAEQKNVATSNAVFYTNTSDPRPIYSYIRFLEDESATASTASTLEKRISDIQEKVRISPHANTGIYCFGSLDTLREYAERIVSSPIRVRGEAYISCILGEMIRENHPFFGIELPSTSVLSLGTPRQMREYCDQTYTFLFDLDGTLVSTESIYYEVWTEILQLYGVPLTPEMFQQSISGKDDLTVFQQCIPRVATGPTPDCTAMSQLKNRLFLQKIDRVEIIPGAVEWVRALYASGHLLAVVTNCNRPVAESILHKTGLAEYFEFIVSAGESARPKPYPDPYTDAIARFETTPEKTIILEDSKTGLMSATAVSPFCILGLETHYTSTELRNCGATMTIKDYTELGAQGVVAGLPPFLREYTETRKKTTMTQNILRSLMPLPIRDVRIHDTKRKGGFIADVYAVEWENADGTLEKCVLKSENPNETFLSHMSKELGLYEREYYFYSALANYVPIRVPKYYGLVKDSQFRNIGILLGDLTALTGAGRTAEFGLDLNTEPLSVSLKVIDTMAKLHAHFWKKDIPRYFPEVRKHDHPMFRPKWSDFLSNRLEPFLEKWKHVLTDSQKILSRTIAESFSQIQRELSVGALTLCHGDVKSANICYCRSERGGEVEPWFLDWQYITFGKGVQDLVFFIIESFDIDHARQYRKLFREYYFVKLAEYGVVDYRVEEYSRDWRNAMYYFPFFVAVWFGTVNDDELIDKNFPYTFIRRLFAFLETPE